MKNKVTTSNNWIDEIKRAIDPLTSQEYDKCIDMLNKIIRHYINDRLCRAISLDCIGQIYFTINEYQYGLNKFNESLVLLKSLYSEQHITAKQLFDSLYNLYYANIIIGNYQDALVISK